MIVIIEGNHKPIKKEDKKRIKRRRRMNRDKKGRESGRGRYVEVGYVAVEVKKRGREAKKRDKKKPVNRQAIK